VDEHRAEAIASLKRHPGWKALFEEMAEQREQFSRTFVDKYLVGNRAVDQRAFDEERGYRKATLFIEGLPELAARELQKISERRTRGEGGE
jgi:hypothetical protein